MNITYGQSSLNCYQVVSHSQILCNGKHTFYRGSRSKSMKSTLIEQAQLCARSQSGSLCLMCLVLLFSQKYLFSRMEQYYNR